MPLLKTAAIVLNSRKWGEADRIVTFYTKDVGKVRGVARGARRQKSRFGAALEPFTRCHVNFFEKPGDSLYRISHVDVVESCQALREELALMGCAARMVNVAGAVTPDRDPDPRVFETLAQGLSSLHGSRDPVLTTLLFQIRLLSITGFRPQTEHCAGCGKPQPRGEPQFSPLAGGFVCVGCAARHAARCVTMSRGSLSFVQQAMRLAPPLLTRLTASGQVRAEVEQAIEGYVTVVAGRRLPPVDFLSVGSRSLMR